MLHNEPKIMEQMVYVMNKMYEWMKKNKKQWYNEWFKIIGKNAFNCFKWKGDEKSFNKQKDESKPWLSV